MALTRNKKWNIFLAIGGTIILVFYGYVAFRILNSERSLFSMMTIPLILGIVVENKRLSSDWKAILLKIFISLLLSLLAFLPGEGGNYNFESNIEAWPYFFIFFFVAASAIYHDKNSIPKLTEGITLLQSVSIIYWIMDVGFIEVKSLFSYAIMGVGLIFCSISFIHAFSYIRLTRNMRLLLSLWSSIIMIVFAVEHIYRVFDFGNSMDDGIINDALGILQYFLLGVSLIYIFQNFRMIMTYLPSRSSTYDKYHRKRIKEMNKTHIERYSQNQINKTNALLALIFTFGIYFVNYKFQLMPRNTMIWMVFWVFPILIWIKKGIEKGKAIDVKEV